MTVEVFTPASTYTVAGIGPYAIGHPYLDGSIRVFVTVNGIEVALTGGDITVTPLSAAVSGSLFLSAGAAATHAGRVLRVERDTRVEQGWLGVLGEREKGLEAQLDRLTYAVQELDAVDARTLRVRDPIPPFVPVADKFLSYDGAKFVSSLGVDEIIAAATGPRTSLDLPTPMTYGAVGDGTFDDRAAFAAMDAAGGHVYMLKPPVAYNVSSPINLNKVGIIVDPTASWEALTDSGNITWTTNLFTQQAPPVPVHRFNGRVLLGDAAHEMAAGWVLGSGNTNDRGPLAWYAREADGIGAYTSRDATMVVANGFGTVAASFAARSSDRWNAAWNAPIGISSYIRNDRDTSNGWGMIVEGRASHANGLTFGIEIAVGNTSGVTRKSDPYNIFGPTGGGGVIGMWFQGGGDASGVDPSTAPNNSPMVVLKGATNTGLAAGWATGIVFSADALVGTDGTAASTTFACALSMARHQRIEWYEPTTEGVGFSITSRVTGPGAGWRMEADNSELDLMRSDGTTFAKIRDNGASGVDYPVWQNGTGGVRMLAEGASTNIDLILQTKGAGTVRPTLPTYADNAAASAASIAVGALYKTATGEVRVRV